MEVVLIVVYVLFVAHVLFVVHFVHFLFLAYACLMFAGKHSLGQF